MFTRSIRSKFLLWLAFLLICLLVGFGVTAFELFRTNQNHQIYEQLQRRLSAVAGDISSTTRSRPPGGLNSSNRGRAHHHPKNTSETDPATCETNQPNPSVTNQTESLEPRRRRIPHDHFDDFSPPQKPGESPTFSEGNEFGPPENNQPNEMGEPDFGSNRSRPEPPALKLSAEVLDLFDQSNPKSFYFAVWSPLGRDRLRSSNAPVELEIVSPVVRAGGPQVRTYGDYFESYLHHVNGYRILVGRSIAPELAARRHFVLWLVAAGTIILVAGLCGSWWLAGRALRPVQKISAAASRISAGNLSERIDVAETDNELGQLATTLNSTFSRLESAFEQQKQFTADASHELRTPLAVMISEAQTTLARPRNESEYRETVEACLTTAQQMRKLTESLLELARYDSGQENIRRTPFDLADLTGDAAGLLKSLAAERNVRIETDLSAAPTTGDADRIRQVIINLISNAIYYNKSEGRVRVSSRHTTGEAIVVVEDNGMGIAAEDLPNIFKRFYRADKARSRASGNSGLGLAICKAIVDAHGGQLTVTSKPGEGTTFTLTLPAPTNT
ncbi:MAG: ATP-binding protein [Verrucomicrobiota bacterium]